MDNGPLLANTNVVVTGAGSGIGRAIAIACARQGASLCLGGRSLSKVEETVAGRNFLRTHRSFLVNLEHARAFQRKHDKVFLVVPGPEDNLVPVSRGHVPEVRKALGL